MRRVVILGQTCAGKSTVAKILARRLGLPFIDLDAIHFLPDVAWAEREMDEKRRLVREVAEGENWVIDGYSNFMKEALLGRVDLVVWIDLPPHRVAPRVVGRSLRRWIRRTPVCGITGNDRSRFLRSGRCYSICFAVAGRTKRSSRLGSTNSRPPELKHSAFDRRERL